MITSPQAVIEEARKFLGGVAWRHQGRDKHGVDCAGLVIISAKKCGWEPRDAGTEKLAYGRAPEDDGLRKKLELEFQEVPFEEAQIADVLLFNFSELSYPHHVGLVSQFRDGQLYFIHADAMLQRVVEHALTGDWRKRVVACYRFFDLV